MLILPIGMVRLVILPALMFRGVTNGYDWYRITGGRQDYVTWFLRGREVTIEVSTINDTGYFTYSCLLEFEFPQPVGIS
jgi:hypothetical protein